MVHPSYLRVMNFLIKGRQALAGAIFVGISLGASAAPVEPLEMSGTMRSEARWLIQSLETMHYLGLSIDGIDAEHFFKKYLDAFDGNRLYFLQEDVEDLRTRFVGPMRTYLRQGNLYPALETFAVYRDRVLERIDFVEERLQQPFDFSVEDEYRFDRSEVVWSENRETADALWEQRLKYELLNHLIPLLDEDRDAPEPEAENDEDPVEPLTEEERFAEALQEATERIQRRYQRLRDYILDIEASEVQEVYLSVLSREFDPHSSFFSAESHEDFAIAMENQLIGIGAVLTEDDGYSTIRELIPGGPAALSGRMNPGDRIVAVAQGDDGEWVDVVDMKLRKVVRKIRGELKTVVRLNVWPAEATDPSVRTEVRLVRDQVKLTANLARAKVFELATEDGVARVGLIDLPSFYGNGDGSSSSTDDVRELIERLKEMEVDGLILDLRRNGGGLLGQAIELTGLFIPEGPVLQIRDHFGRTRQHHDLSGELAWDGPLMVLVSRFSASASEIVAGALRDHRRAMIVGDPSTHGKGTVQGVFQRSLGQSAAAKITVSQYYLPSGDSTQERGVPSDIVIPSTTPFLPVGESDLENAMPWSSLQPLAFLNDLPTDRYRGVEPGLVERLREKSEKRQQVLEEFEFLRDRIDFIRERQAEEVVSLQLERRLEQRREQRSFQDRLDAVAERLNKEAYDFTEVLLQVAKEREEEVVTLDVDDSGIEMPSQLGDLDVGLRESLRIMSDWALWNRSGKTEVARHAAET